MDLISLDTSLKLTHPRPAIRGETVQAYGNLVNGKVSLKVGRWVIGHAWMTLLDNVKFTVNEATRLKVLTRKKRMVHAFAVGELAYVNNEFNLLSFEDEIHYNPFRAGHFTKKDGSAIWEADSALVVAGVKNGKRSIFILTNPVVEL